MLVHELNTGTYHKSLLNTRMLTYPAGGLKFGLVFIYIHTLQCVRAAEKVWRNFKNAQANLSRGTCDKVTKSHVLTHIYM